MAHLLGTQSVAAMAGSRRLLESVDVGLDDGSRVGILGPNGAGKSTLLRIVAGIQEPDGGVVTRRDGLRVAVLSQADALDPADTVAAAVHPGRAEYEWASDPRVRDIHEGLLASVPLAAAVGALSGGQRRRVALARVLAADADIVCLDEPTNHLDVEGVAWLAHHLNARFARPGASGALLAVTHDRWFLDAVCEHIWEVVPGVDPGGKRPQIPGRVEIYDGSYAAYTLARAERARQAGVAARKRANLLTKELAWLRRGAPARTSKPKFHIAAAEALIADAPPPRDSVELVEMASARLGKDVIDLEDVSVSFTRPDSSRLDVLRGVTWRLAPGERVGVVGVNGAGKTTVLNLLRGEVEPTGGRVRRGKTVKAATLSQETRELDAVAGMRVVEAVADIAQVVVAGGQGDHRPADDRAHGLHPGTGPHAGQGDLRRGTAPPAAHAPAHVPTERPAARRAHERPRHRHSGRHGGPPRLLRGHPGGGLPRPLPVGARHRPPGRATGRRDPPCPARGSRAVPPDTARRGGRPLRGRCRWGGRRRGRWGRRRCRAGRCRRARGRCERERERC